MATRILGLSIEDFAKTTAALTLEETGAFARLAALCLANPKTGGVVITLAKIGADAPKAWELLTSLALRGIVRAQVIWGESTVVIDDEMRWAEITPRLNTVVRVEIDGCTSAVNRLEKRREQVRECVRRHRAKIGGVIQNNPKCNNVIQKNSITCNQVIQEGCKVDSNARACEQVREGARGLEKENICKSPLYPPLGGSVVVKAKKTEKFSKNLRVAENSPLMVRIGAWFGRKAQTLWTIDEAQRLEAVSPSEEELDLLERYYSSESPDIKPYRRRNVQTLLNNWTADCDVARRKLEQAGDIASAASSLSSYGFSPIGDFTIV